MFTRNFQKKITREHDKYLRKRRVVQRQRSSSDSGPNSWKKIKLKIKKKTGQKIHRNKNSNIGKHHAKVSMSTDLKPILPSTERRCP